MNKFEIALSVVALGLAQAACAEEIAPEKTEVWEPEPAMVTPGDGTAPPSDAIVLFDGKSLGGWQPVNGVFRSLGGSHTTVERLGKRNAG